jgi:hypothetical protein
MKNRFLILSSFLFFLFIFCSEISLGQGLRIEWTDNYGRDFYVIAPSGEFNYSMISGDRIEYEKYGDFAGQVIKIGNVYIEYERYGDLKGKITKVGNVRLEYELYGANKGRLAKVGGLTIKYELYGLNAGRITGTSGHVVY